MEAPARYCNKNGNDVSARWTMGRENKTRFFSSPQPPYDTKRPLQRIEIQKDGINIPHVAKFLHLLIFASNVDFAGIAYLG